MDDKLTPKLIISQLMDFKISDKEAVEKIEMLIQSARDEVIGNMGATEYKYFIGIIKGYYKSYGYPIKGSMDDIKDILNTVIKQCGFNVFEEIKNTQRNRQMIEDELMLNAAKYFG